MSELLSGVVRSWVEEYVADVGALERRYPLAGSQRAIERKRASIESRLEGLDATDFDRLHGDDRVDWILLRNRLLRDFDLLDGQQQAESELGPLLPFQADLVALEERRMDFQWADPQDSAATLDTATALLKGLSNDPPQADRSAAYAAVGRIDKLKETLETWRNFYDGYDPLFGWWVREPYKALVEALDAYRKSLRENVLGLKEGDDEPIIGRPVGEDALVRALRREWIEQSPDELIAIGEREMAWCERQFDLAARDLNVSGRREALDLVKRSALPPGEQPRLVRDLAWEAIEYVEQNELVTVPDLAKETWRLQMMPAEYQKSAPFFLGGEQISVSYATDAMPHEEKLMSMRGNNPHFSRATVHHELIPGHHLQSFMEARHRPYRQAFWTPFWVEGWTLHWEFLLWDRGFPRGPEDRVGMLFWRLHRAARIVFSLKFHLGLMSPDECVDYLVERVGHERANAEGEIRRSVGPHYPPLYQAAYMLGALQVHALHAELVLSGKLSEREFHDRFLEQNMMPIEVMAAVLRGQRLEREFRVADPLLARRP